MNISFSLFDLMSNFRFCCHLENRHVSHQLRDCFRHACVTGFPPFCTDSNDNKEIINLIQVNFIFLLTRRNFWSAEKNCFNHKNEDCICSRFTTKFTCDRSSKCFVTISSAGNRRKKLFLPKFQYGRKIIILGSVFYLTLPMHDFAK